MKSLRSLKDYIEEKKLTPAEMKKREEIAQAIERENPDMPMGKKMAIATAQAKKVAEGKDEELPFEPDEKPKQVATPGKNRPAGMSTAAHLARMAMQKVIQKKKQG